MLILLDQDGVLADFEGGFYRAWTARNHAHPAIPLEARRVFHLVAEYPSHLSELVMETYSAPGFFRDLQPIPGALDAIRDLLELGHDVRICTAPINQYRNCVPEKFEWVERHLGHDFINRIVLTKDKTLVHGDVLVDDKPEVTGGIKPHWQHIVYDQPYNRHVAGPRMTWANWREVLGQDAKSAYQA